MKSFFATTAAVVAALCIFSSVAYAQYQPPQALPPGVFVDPIPQPTQPPTPNPSCLIPDLFLNLNTKFNFSDSSQQCQKVCKRRSVHEWSEADWDLYAKLWTELNNRGWMNEINLGHALDGCAPTGPHFHHNESFFAWHRVFITHFEQLMQKVDHEINPDQVAIRGEFCLGYWDWGYHEEFNNDLTDYVYKYVFRGKGIGTLLKNLNQIPDSKFAFVKVGGEPVTRKPLIGNLSTPDKPYTEVSWNKVVVSACLSITDMVGNGIDTEHDKSFWACSEEMFHGAIHQAVGGRKDAVSDSGSMGNLKKSSMDPVFFLHHAMVDKIWWEWQKYAQNTYPQSWNEAPVPSPYNQWTQAETKDYSRFCYEYADNAPPTDTNAHYTETTGAPGDFGALPYGYDVAVEKVIKQGRPEAIKKEDYTVLLEMAANAQEADKMYDDYLKYVRYCQEFHSTIYDQYQKSHQRFQESKIVGGSVGTPPAINRAPVVGTPPSFAANRVVSNQPTSKNVAKILNYLTGNAGK